MENNETYCYFFETLYKTDANENDFFINPYFHDSWQEADFESGHHPRASYPKLTREEALEFAKKLGMSEEAFNG